MEKADMKVWHKPFTASSVCSIIPEWGVVVTNLRTSSRVLLN